MTITNEERQRIVNGSDEVTASDPRYHRSGIATSLMGMLAALGMLTFLSVVVGAGAVLLDIELGFVSAQADLQELSAIGLSITALVVLASALIGGLVAGRLARYGGMLVGLFTSLWLTLVLAIFAGLAWWVGIASETLDGLDLTEELSDIATAELTTAAAIAGGGLLVLALLGGMLGGRIGQTEEKPAKTVVDLRYAEEREPEATEVDDTRTSV
jgi:hypothetical protein